MKTSRQSISVNYGSEMKFKEFEELSERITKIEKVVSSMEQRLNELWYSPGMPGYQEAKKSWDQHSLN
jgi:hypothetical protein